MSFAPVFVGAFLILAASVQAQNGAITIGQHSLLVEHTAEVTWDEASSICQEKGMQLLSLPTKAKNDLISGYLLKTIDFHVHFWTSGKRTGSQFTWTAVNLPFTFTNWGRNHPRQARDCVTFVEDHNGGDTYTWHSEQCQRSNGYICERV